MAKWVLGRRLTEEQAREQERRWFRSTESDAEEIEALLASRGTGVEQITGGGTVDLDDLNKINEAALRNPSIKDA